MLAHAIFAMALGLAVVFILGKADFCFVKMTRDVTRGDPTPLMLGAVAIASAALAMFATGKLGWREAAPWAWPSAVTLLGAIAFGVGARLNGACAVGTMQRLTRGDIGGLCTMLGGFMAALLAPKTVVGAERPVWAESYEPIWVAASLVLAIVLGLIAVRANRALSKYVVGGAIIGALVALANALRGQTTFFGLTRTLIGDPSSLILGAAIAFAIVGIAMAGAAAMGRITLHTPKFDRLLLEFVGGLLMALGATAIPGASEVVAFYGVASGSPHAITALVIIFLTVASSFILTDSRLWRENIAPLLPQFLSDGARSFDNQNDNLKTKN